MKQRGLVRTKGDEGEVFADLAVPIELRTREGEKEVTYICQTSSVNETSCRGSDITSSLLKARTVHGAPRDSGRKTIARITPVAVIATYAFGSP